MRDSKLSARLRAKRTEARGLVLWIARGFVLGLFGLGASAAAQLAADRPDPAVLPQGEPPVEVSNEESETRDQRLLRQAVFCDRNVQCTLETAATALKSGDVHQAVGRLQQVLDLPGDHFIWVESESRLSSARRRAVSLLSTADAKTREFYAWAHAGEAQRLLDHGLKTSDPAVIAEVARRFFHTSAGFDATNWLATRWLDRGEYALSIRAWKLLAADPCHRKRLNAAIQQKLGVAERLCGGGSLNDRYAVSGPSAPSGATSSPHETRPTDQSASSRTADLAALEEGAATDQPPAEPPVEHATASFESFATKSPGTGLFNDSSSIPYMTPSWRVGLVGPKTSSDSEIAELIRRWEIQSSQHDDKRPIAVQAALVVGKALVLRDYGGFRALDAESGRELWKSVSTTCLARAVAETEPGHAAAEYSTSHETSRDVLMGAYVGNSILGTMTTDGRRVFAVDSMDIRPRQAGVPTDENGDSPHGSQRLSRNANRLIALDVHSPSRDTAGLVKPVWSVGGAVGMSHWFYRMDANDDGRVTQTEFLGTPEQFKELDHNGDGSIDAKEAEQARDKMAQQPLHGHFFLGPPLALDGRLYAITETDCQLNLVALSAATGAVLWVQGIGYVDRPIDEEPQRYALACTPSSGSGVIVCPTQAGLLVGVDALDGALLWSYYCGDDDGSAPDTSWSFASRHTFGNPGFPNAAIVEGNQVVVLPRQSETIQCLDLATGRGLWKKPRGDGEFVAAAADGVVMIVGERLCRGLSLTNGAEQWSIRVGEVSGAGVRLGGEYLLPLADNRIAAIDIRSGMRSRDMSTHDEDNLERSSPQTDDFRANSVAAGDTTEVDSSEGHARSPGNLVAAGSLIVSCGPREIVAYPRAEALLEKLEQKLASGTPAPADLALAADLELTLGQILDAKAFLARISSSGLPDELQQRTERLKRTVLLEELAAGCARPAERLHELDRLSRTPSQRFRLLQAKSEIGIRNGDLSAVFDATRAFASLGDEGLLAVQSDPAFLTSARGWLAATDERVRRSFSSQDLDSAKSRIAMQQRAALQSNDSQILERFLAVYGRWPEADAVRLRIAEVASAAGQWQRAELLLISCERSSRAETARTAQQQLVRLWDRAGLAEEAADLLFQMQKQDGLEKRDPEECERLIEELPPDGLTRRALKRLKATEEPFGRARLSQSLWEHVSPELAEKFANASRPSVTRATSAFQLIDAGTTTDPKVSIVDRLSGTIVGPLEIPAHYWGLTLAVTSQVGHFIPLGSRAAFHGVSLLEHDAKRPLWTAAPQKIAKDQDAALVGPSGPMFCAFQSHRHLFVVDPGTGKLIWHRTDLDPQSGLVPDPNRGIFGDDEALVVMGADRLSYTVYRTSTGEELRQGHLDPSTRQIPERRAFGRCLLYFTSREGAHRMRIWDPLGDRLLYDAPISDRLLWKETGDDEVAVITAGGSLQIVDGHTGAVRVDFKLDARENQNLCQVTVFRDADRYYINLQPLQTISEPRRYSYCFGTDAALPHVDLRGNLLAIDRRSGQLLWKRNFAQRTVLRVPTLHLPVLVMLALVGDRLNGNHRSMLVEAVDAKTGDTLAFDDDRLPNRVLQMTFEEDRRRIRLWGTRSVVDLDFASHAAPLAAENSHR